MTKKLLLITLLVILFAGIAVAAVRFLFPYQPDQPPQIDNIGSTQQGIQDVVNANNQFAFDLYFESDKYEDGNMFYSPYSISAALAMTYEGAKGQTADEIKSVFHFPEDNILRPNFAAIYNDINKENENYELKTGNALWAQQDFPFLPEYISRVENYYGGKASMLDFIGETEKSRQTINSFIEEQTKDKIKNLIPAGSLDKMTRLVLTNAIYFKGIWEWEFDKTDTRDGIFKITPNDTVETSMMNMNPEEAKFNYAETEDLQILELPYKGDKISMLILLPTENLDAIGSILTAEKLNEYKSQMKETKIDSISLPKFEFDAKYFMNNTLSSLGMPIVFSENADFSGMTGKKDLFISSVIHQAYISVDEEGTEAAAATAVVMTMGISFEPRKIFNADHPFIFVIQEKETGNILFLGRIVDPTK
jgi:serpin B